MKDQIIQIQEGGYIAKINVSRGANCISLRNTRHHATILREPNYDNLDNPYLYGMPILYPNNRIFGGAFIFEGREYRFPINEPSTGCHIHGTLHETPFVLTDSGEDYAVCVYRATKENPYGEFPHEFEITMRYSISQDGLTHETTVTNLSQENMPNLLGFHTTFAIPFLRDGAPQGVRVCMQAKDEVERDKRYLPTGKILPDDEITKKLCKGAFMTFERKLSRQYFVSGDGKITLTDVKEGRTIVYETDKKYGYRLLYNGNADEYITIEPQTCMANCPNAPFDRAFSGFDYVAPKQSKTYICKLYIQ